MTTWAIGLIERIGTPDNGPLITRWGIKTPYGGAYLHKMHRADADRHLHDHPWPFVSIVLRGGYTENWAPSPAQRYSQLRRVPRIRHMPITAAHRIIAVKPNTWTLVLFGRRRKSWGFWVAGNIIDYRSYLRMEA